VCGTSYEPEEFHKLMNIAVGQYLEEGGKFIDIMRARLSFILTNVHNFTYDVSNLMNSKEAFLKFCREKNIRLHLDGARVFNALGISLLVPISNKRPDGCWSKST
jgi:hypothetical protein